MTTEERKNKRAIDQYLRHEARKAKVATLTGKARRAAERRLKQQALKWFVNHFNAADANETMRLSDTLRGFEDPQGMRDVLQLVLANADRAATVRDLLVLATRVYLLGPGILVHLRELWHPPESINRDCCLLLAIQQMAKQMEAHDLSLTVVLLKHASTWMTSSVVPAMFLSRLIGSIENHLDPLRRDSSIDSRPRVWRSRS